MPRPSIPGGGRDPAATNGAHRRGGARGPLRILLYVSQENLIGGLVAIGALALLLVVSQPIPPRITLRALLCTGIGFAAVAAVVFSYYAVNGDIIRFLQLYYLIPPAVAAG